MSRPVEPNRRSVVTGGRHEDWVRSYPVDGELIYLIKEFFTHSGTIGAPSTVRAGLIQALTAEAHIEYVRIHAIDGRRDACH